MKQAHKKKLFFLEEQGLNLIADPIHKYVIFTVPFKRQNSNENKEATEKDIIEFTSMGYVDGFGKKVARYFIADKVSIGLSKNTYSRFEEFSEEIYRKKEVNKVLSLNFIKDSGFEWFEK